MHDLIGLMGMFIIVITLLIQQFNILKDKGENIISLMFILGSGGILYSLCFDWNLSAAILNLSVILIAGMALVSRIINK